MTNRRVFISSVMDGYVEQRAAARAAVELLGLHPVMAESFGARPYSPQRACLEGVQESDVVVLLLGRRYGFIAQSGKSVTEEEFACARERGIPILVFLENVTREPEQEGFVRRISSYEEGFHRVTFSTPAELKDQVIKALSASLNGAKTIDEAGARVELNRVGWGSRKERDRGSWLGGVILPRRRQPFISPVKLGDKEFQRQIKKEAVYGDAAIFDGDYGVKTQETETSAIFVQPEEQRPRVSLEVRTDGTLIFGKLLAATEPRTYCLARSFIVDEEEFQSSLASFFRFANQVYGLLEDNPVLTSFYFGGSLSGIQQKMFGRIPSPEPTSFSMNMNNFGDPLLLPRDPQPLSRAELFDGVRPASEIKELVARTFRANRAYYTP